jgi:hypothetical protein
MTGVIEAAMLTTNLDTNNRTIFAEKNGVFWDVKPCGFVRTGVSEELSASIIPDDEGAKLLRNVVLTRATRRNIPEDAILHNHLVENLTSYIFSLCLNP